jgi:hypothetical protein
MFVQTQTIAPPVFATLVQPNPADVDILFLQEKLGFAVVTQLLLQKRNKHWHVGTVYLV